MKVLAWQTAALKYLLGQSSGYQPDTTLDQYEDDDDEQTATLAAELDEVRDVQQRAPQCAHRQQVIVNGQLRCGACGYAFGVTGVTDVQRGVIGHVPGSGTRPGQRG